MKRAEKEKLVQELAEAFKEHSTIGFASLYRMGADQLNGIRRKFRGKVTFRVVRNSFIRMALTASGKPGLERLGEFLTESGILLYTNLDPFELTQKFRRGAIRVKARAGDVAEEEIVVPSGNTGLPPGPVISELESAGIRTRIESGSVWIAEDTVVAEKGDVISEQVARALNRLRIEPMKVTLSLIAAYDNGTILTSDVLNIDETRYMSDLQLAAKQSLAIAIKASYPCPETIGSLIQRAIVGARTLGLSVAHPAPELLPELLAKAHWEALVLNGILEKAS
ncbi:MAG: 50S ribosomal protein L10 [Candidatus Bathyarchaeia archaeon]